MREVNGVRMTAAPGRQTKYDWLCDELMREIGEGMDSGAPLPSERELMERYEVSRVTVRSAIGRLVDDGVVYRVQGAGTFVAEPGKITKSLAMTSFSEDIRARRMRPGGQVLAIGITEADVPVARDLGLAPGSPVVHLERLRTADGEPMCLENTWLPQELVPDLVEDGLDGRDASLYALLDELGIVLERADQRVRGTVVNKREAGLLDVPPHSPALDVGRVAYDRKDRAVERARSIYRADRYSFEFTAVRRRARS